MKMHICILLFVCLFINACGATSPNELRNKPTKNDNFVVDNSFENVYDNILSKFDECYPVPKENRINLSKGSGHIITRYQGNYGIVVDITRLEQSKTKVDIYSYFNFEKPFNIIRHGAFNRHGCP